MALTPHVDNSPVRCMLEAVQSSVRRLGFQGCEVEQVKLDGFRASILVAASGALQAEFEEGRYHGVRWGEIRILWRAQELQGEISQGGEGD